MRSPRLALTLFAAAIVSLAPAAVTAQTLTPDFQYSFPADGSVGGNPQEALIQASDGNLYSVSFAGGSNQNGTVVKVTPAGVASVFYECSANGVDCEGLNNIIQLPDGNFWGTSVFGGAKGFGNIFTISPGGVFSDKYDFTNDEYGAYPNSEIVYVPSCGCIYGTTVGYAAVQGSSSGTAPNGTLYSFSVNLTKETGSMLHAYDFGISGSDNNLGVQPVTGVTVVNGTVYGTSQVGGDNTNYGVLWSFKSDLSSHTILHNFSDGLDGAYPSGAPRYYRPDGNIYGTTLQSDDDQPDSGSIYKSGLTSGFAPVFTFTDTAIHNFNGPPAFDTAGNLIVGAGQGGTNGVGALYSEPRSGGTSITTLFNFATGSIYGDHPQSAPFFDNTGKMWTVERGGTSNLLGALDEWTLSTETAAPITISVTPTTVDPNTNVTVKWSGNNLFSDEQESCWASGGNSNFQGVQTGTYSNGIYSGSKTFSAGSTTGTQVLTIVCGGRESASVTLTVGSSTGPVATTTTVTATPNPVTSGSNVTLSATVKKDSGSGVPTGNVTFKVGSTTLEVVSVNGSGVASLSAPTTGYPTGTYTITGTYSGDSNDDASSGSTNVTINTGTAVTTTTTLTAPTNPVTTGNTVTLLITVTRGSGSGYAGGKVQIKDGSTVLATTTLSSTGTVDFQTSSSGYPVGVYPLTASYLGDADDKPSSSSTLDLSIIKKTTATSLATSASSVKIGSDVTLTATVTPQTGTATGKVEFKTGSTVLATVTLSGDKAVLTAPTTGYPAGTYPITAVYLGDADDDTSTSAAVDVTLHN
jgi:uncharacterized repeat protein (TIGR03803 family)